MGVQHIEKCPCDDWQTDFTQLPQTTGKFKQLLVFADTFLNWVETFPTPTKKAPEVAKALLKEIILRYGLPTSIETDSGLSFITVVTQQVSNVWA